MKLLGWLLFFLTGSLQAAPVNEWTVLYYSGADDPELLQGTTEGLKRLESIPTLGEKVAFVAQVDWPGDDPNYRYELRYVPNPSLDKVDTKPIPEAEVQRIDPGFRYGEKDSGSPAELKAFLRWAVRAYPAKHYLLVLAGHSWGQLGVLQDFYVGGQALDESTLLRNYEVRRVLEETYRESSAFIPHGRFDALFVDACIFGQLEVALELQGVADYFAASALETPMNSFPYDRVFAPFLEAVEKGSKQPLERAFFRPLVEEYIRSHGPQGDVAAKEGMVDPVQFMVLRNSELPAVAAALAKLLKSLPEGFARRWWEGKYPALDVVADADRNADLAVVARTLGRLAAKEGAKEAERAAEELTQLLGASADAAMKRTSLKHKRAAGAWAHLDLETVAPSWQLAACTALKALTLANALGAADFLPQFAASEKEGEPVKTLAPQALDCHGAMVESEESEMPLKAGVPVAIEDMFGIEVSWPSGVPAHVSLRKGGGRELSVWVPAKAGSGLNRSLVLRVAGSRGLRVEYVKRNPKRFLKGKEPSAGLGGFSEKFPSEYFRFPASGPYAAEGHSNGTHFKQGLSVFLGREFPKDNPYQWGKLPLALVEKSPYSMTTEQYETIFSVLSPADQANYVKRGFAFFRLHAFARSTGWLDFLEGAP